MKRIIASAAVMGAVFIGAMGVAIAECGDGEHTAEPVALVEKKKEAPQKKTAVKVTPRAEASNRVTAAVAEVTPKVESREGPRTPRRTKAQEAYDAPAVRYSDGGSITNGPSRID